MEASKKKRNKKKKGSQPSNPEESVEESERPAPAGIKVLDSVNGIVPSVEEKPKLAYAEQPETANSVKQKILEDELVTLQENVKLLENERASHFQKVANLEEEIEILQKSLSACVHNEAALEGRLTNLHISYDSLTKKEAIFDEKITGLEGFRDAWMQNEMSLRESIAGLEAANKTLQKQVMDLEASSASAAEENRKLIERVSEMESRMDEIVTKICLLETLEVYETQGKVATEQEKLAERNDAFPGTQEEKGIEGSHTDIDFSSTEGNPSSISNELDSRELVMDAASESSLQDLLMHNSNHRHSDLIDVPLQHQRATFLSPYDGVQIHEKSTGEAEENTPLSDAPLIGAPFRLFSFMAKYVAGSDLVNRDQSSH